MKKIWSLFLVVLLMLTVVGCGAKESKIGETINVDGVEFTLTNFELANRVGYKKSTAFGVLDESAEYYYKANYTENQPYSPQDGNVFAVIEYTISNKSKDEFKFIFDLEMLVNYNDGYTYGGTSVDYKTISITDNKFNTELQPLDEKSFRSIIECKDVVMNDKDGSLSLDIELCGKKFTFKIR